MSPSSEPKESERKVPLRDSGLAAVGSIPWGTHFCQFYEAKGDLIETLVPYMKAGIEANEFCVWVTSQVLNVREAKTALHQAVPGLERFLAERRIEILHRSKCYEANGKFHPEKAIKEWACKLDRACRRGLDGLRVAGDLSWLERESWKGFTGYETCVDCAIGPQRMLALCAYPLQKCGTREILDVAANHEFALIRNGNGWQILQSTARLRAEREFGKFASLADNNSEFIGIWAMDFKPLYLNRAGLGMAGLADIRSFEETPLKEFFFPEDQDFILNKFLPQVLSGGQAEVEIRFRHFKTGEPLWMIFNVFLLRGDRGEPIGIATVSRNITERKRAEDDARWNAKRNELLSGIAARLLRTSDPKAEVEDLCRNVREFLGCDAYFTDYTVDGCAARLDLDSCAGAGLHYGAVICGCATDDVLAVASEDISAIAALQTKWVKPGGTGAYCCHPLVVGGRVIGTLSFGSQSRREFSAAEIEVMQSVTHLVSLALNRVQSEAAVSASEARFRGLFEHAATGIAIKDLEGRFQACNPAYAAMLGYAAEELRGLGCKDLMHPNDYATNMVEQKRLLAGEIPSFESMTRYFRKQGGIMWGKRHVSLLQDNTGKPASIIVLLTDMTEHRRHEEQINLLLREVNHRSKNMLTLVQAVARQTVASDPGDFLERFGERVQALAASQDLLVKSGWNGVELGELVRSQLAHFKDLIGSRIELAGPPLAISAPAAQPIGMALHELATNAGKYGALANGSGRISIAWSVKSMDGKKPVFTMIWRERGGPPVKAPARQGFGTAVMCEMAEMSLSAAVSLDFKAAGLTWRLRSPAEEVLDESQSARPSRSAAAPPASVSAPARSKPAILVVEDEPLVAMEIAGVLKRGGFEIVGPARTLFQGLELLRAKGCDAAVLDINLGKETSELVALELKERGTPFVALSGYTPEQYPPAFHGAPALAKPLRLEALVAEVRRCIEEEA
jgi:PAS domain S-box-containing protein